MVIALVLATVLGGCSSYRTYEKCGFAGCAGDADITAGLRQQLREDAAIEEWSIKVQTLDRTVYLYGIVDTELERNIIEAMARAYPGVENVVDSIGIRGNSW